MRCGRLLATVMAGLVGIAGLGGALAQSGDTRNGEDGSGFVELEVREDSLGNKVLVDPRTGQVLGMVLELHPLDDPATKGDKLGVARLRAATAVKLSVTDVIKAAEQHAGGSKVLEARFRPTASAAAYSLKTYRDGVIWEQEIDADSGEMLNPGRTTPESQLDEEERADLSGVETASTTIVQAVRIAEQHARGKAISAAIDEADEGGTVWKVVVVANDQALKIVIDPATGQVRSNSPRR
jgi:uncharacterized membrane protein YkoI